jgi:hypothetical protein
MATVRTKAIQPVSLAWRVVRFTRIFFPQLMCSMQRGGLWKVMIEGNY